MNVNTEPEEYKDQYVAGALHQPLDPAGILSYYTVPGLPAAATHRRRAQIQIPPIQVGKGGLIQ